MDVAPVLIIDNDEGVRDALRFAFAMEGIAVRLYEDAPTLLQETWCPQGGCLIVDQMMPTMSGTELLQILWDRGCRIPAILITTRADPGLRRRAARLGVRAVLEKPLSDNALIDHAQRALRKS